MSFTSPLPTRAAPTYHLPKALPKSMLAADKVHQLVKASDAFAKSKSFQQDISPAKARGALKDAMKAQIKRAAFFGAGVGSAMHRPVDKIIGTGIDELDYKPVSLSQNRWNVAKELFFLTRKEQGVLAPLHAAATLVAATAGTLAGGFLGALGGGLVAGKNRLLKQPSQMSAKEKVILGSQAGGVVGGVGLGALVFFGGQAALEMARVATGGAKGITWTAGLAAGALVGAALCVPMGFKAAFGPRFAGNKEPIDLDSNASLSEVDMTDKPAAAPMA